MIELKDYPFTVPSRLPYSNSTFESNLEKIRFVVCAYCKYQMPTHITAPICGVCNQEMITVIK